MLLEKIEVSTNSEDFVAKNSCEWSPLTLFEGDSVSIYIHTSQRLKILNSSTVSSWNATDEDSIDESLHLKGSTNDTQIYRKLPFFLTPGIRTRYLVEFLQQHDSHNRHRTIMRVHFHHH
uniref:Uncharacterized protein n=1 Tax=Physcomitrium patens TaxID=3218 RepID=A0A2K1L770_PHYPA|nr:hypothetical protein PHYPA_000301 [Physcomitrium patens]